MGKPKSGLQQDDLTPSTLPSDHTIVKLGAAQGSGNYMSLDAEGNERLVELSGRVKRSKIIITRGTPMISPASSEHHQRRWSRSNQDTLENKGLGIMDYGLSLMCSSGVGFELTTV